VKNVGSSNVGSSNFGVEDEIIKNQYNMPNFSNITLVAGSNANAIKLSTSWQDKPLAERSRSLQIRFDSTQRTA
jgi:hypothetical protein